LTDRWRVHKLIRDVTRLVDERFSGSFIFTEIFGFRVESRTGTLKILEDAWQSAKEVVVNKKR